MFCLSFKGYGITSAIAGLVVTGLLTGCDLVSAIDPMLLESETTSYEQQLATHLRQTNAKFYGAYWCPYCADQKAMFGKAAVELPYVECDPQGENPQPDLCDAKQIAVYPTWEIKGELYPGLRSLLQLAALSDYKVEAETDSSFLEPKP